MILHIIQQLRSLEPQKTKSLYPFIQRIQSYYLTLTAHLLIIISNVYNRLLAVGSPSLPCHLVRDFGTYVLDVLDI
jgi:hypothetical protein